MLLFPRREDLARRQDHRHTKYKLLLIYLNTLLNSHAMKTILTIYLDEIRNYVNFIMAYYVKKITVNTKYLHLSKVSIK